MKIKNEYDYWRHLLLTGAGYTFLGTPIGGIASWLICEKWRIQYNNSRLCFDALSVADKIRYIEEVYGIVKTFPLNWKKKWTSFLMLFDKYILKDWSEDEKPRSRRRKAIS